MTQASRGVGTRHAEACATPGHGQRGGTWVQICTEVGRLEIGSCEKWSHARSVKGAKGRTPLQICSGKQVSRKGREERKRNNRGLNLGANLRRGQFAGRGKDTLLDPPGRAV